MKHRIVHALQKYVLNPPIKLLFAVGVAPPGYALLEIIGRTTEKSRLTPIGAARIGNRFWIVAEHGMKEGYIRNIAHNPRVRVKLREGLLIGAPTQRMCSRTMIHARGSAGLRDSCLAAERMRPPCASSGRLKSFRRYPVPNPTRDWLCQLTLVLVVYALAERYIAVGYLLPGELLRECGK